MAVESGEKKGVWLLGGAGNGWWYSIVKMADSYEALQQGTYFFIINYKIFFSFMKYKLQDELVN